MAYRQTPAVQARRAEARVNIRLAAQAMVAAEGFSGTQMTAIARRAGVATGTLYNHFPSREELFTEVFRRLAGHELALARITMTRVAMTGDGPATARLEKSLRDWCHRANQSGRLAYALLAEPVDETVAAERSDFRRAYTNLFAELIEEGITAGEFPPQNSAVSAAGLIGALAEILVRPLADDAMSESGRIDVLTDNILGFCMGGVTRPRA